MTTLSTPLLPFLAPGGGGGGSGTVTSVSVATANGFAGTVATATTTPAITVKTGVTGLLKGNGTAVSAATANTDYLPVSSPAMTGTPTAPTAALATNTTQVATCAFVIANAGTANDPWVFPFAPIGGGANDTAAFNTLQLAAWTYAANNQGYAKIKGAPSLYAWKGALSHNYFSNSQAPIPFDNTNPNTIIIEYDFEDNGAVNPYFGSTGPTFSGAVFQTSLTSQSYDATFGPPSLMGGPTLEQGYGQGSGIFANTYPIIKGITFMTDVANPTIGGLILPGTAKARVQGSCFPDATLSAMNGTQPTNFWANGLYMPTPLNNDNCQFDWTAYGMYRGAMITPHCTGTARALYCERAYGILIAGDGHSPAGLYLSAELCTWGIFEEDSGFSGHPVGVNIFLDTENMSKYASGGHVSDASSQMGGQILVNQFDGTALVVNGAANVQIIAAAQARGWVSGPSVPATTVAVQNPYWKNASVYLTSGGAAVTAIKVNGTTTGLTLGTTGTVMVQVDTGDTISWTGAGAAPTWAWKLA